MKTALLLALAATLLICRAGAVEAGTTDCPALLASRNPEAARTAALVHRAETEAEATEVVAAKPARTPGALLRSLLHLGQKKSEGLIVKDSANCRVALNASYGKVTPVAANGVTTMLVVTW